MNIVELPLTEEVSGFETSASPSCASGIVPSKDAIVVTGLTSGLLLLSVARWKRSSLSSSKDTGQPVLSLNLGGPTAVGRNISRKSS